MPLNDHLCAVFSYEGDNSTLRHMSNCAEDQLVTIKGCLRALEQINRDHVLSPGDKLIITIHESPTDATR